MSTASPAASRLFVIMWRARSCAAVRCLSEGATEVGFVTTLINRSLGEDMRRYGIWVSDGGSNSEALAVLRDIADSGLKVAGFADNEGTQMGLWQQVKDIRSTSS